MPNNGTTASRRGRPSKVARLIDDYELTGLGATLEARWTADGSERASLRDLADYFNKQVLEEALREAGLQPLDGEVANTYRLLTEDDVSAGDRTRAERRLAREGIDDDALTADFVSYQAIRTYLQNERDVSYECGERDRTEAARTTIDQLRGRTVSVTESRIDDLIRTGDVQIASPTAIVDIQIRCDDCGRQHGVSEFLERGLCDCYE